MQPELLRGQKVGAEVFHVRTFYDWHGPCTIITVLDSNPKHGASYAVVAVREFLKGELAKTPGSVRLAVVGPSPFHMDCAIEASADLDSSVVADLVGVFGYAHYVFRYNEQVFDTLDDAEDFIIESLRDELQLYYELVRRWNRGHLRAEKLSERAEGLIQMNQAEGWRASFARLFRGGATARRIGLDALSAQLMAAADSAYAEEYIRSVSRDTMSLKVLLEDLERKANESYLAPIVNTLEVVRLVESSRSKEFEVAVVGASTLLGGMAGAIAAVVAS